MLQSMNYVVCEVKNMRDSVIDYFKYLLQGDDLTLLREGVNGN
ncbi:hypothetical protein AAEX37_00455 [Oligella sp. MSHR50489EDL]